MDKELKKALTELTEGADPGRVEEAVRERIGKVENGTGTGWIWYGYRRPVRILLTAVMVLLLSVSVYAAVQKLMTVTLPEEGPSDVVVEILEDAGKMVVLPEEKRKELQAHVITQEDIKNGTYAEKQREFDTWEDAAAWLDCGLLTSDLLTEAEGEWGEVRLRVYGDVYPELGKQSSVSLIGTAECPLLLDASVMLTMTIPLSGDWKNYGTNTIYITDKVYEPDETVGLNLNEHEKVSTGEQVIQYTTVSGISAEIAVVTVPKARAILEDGKVVGTEYHDSTWIHMNFLHEGILYELQFSAPDAESGTETAKTIAESMK